MVACLHQILQTSLNGPKWGAGTDMENYLVGSLQVQGQVKGLTGGKLLTYRTRHGTNY